MVDEEWGDLALACNRDEFARRYEHPFLYAQRAALKPVRPQRTERLEITGLIPIFERDEKAPAELVVLPIKKVQLAFPSMITVGRTANNDLMVSDPQISKFHAFFKQATGGAWEIADAGSRNGTFLHNQPLEPKRPAVIGSGDKLKFAALEFQFLDAAGLWTVLVAALDRWGD
jgi:pSer/pThr/pTyr-binding forkhead associated (FHA) protein